MSNEYIDDLRQRAVNERDKNRPNNWEHPGMMTLGISIGVDEAIALVDRVKAAERARDSLVRQRDRGDENNRELVKENVDFKLRALNAERGVANLVYLCANGKMAYSSEEIMKALRNE